MADFKNKKQKDQLDDFEEGYENKPDENSQDFNDDIDIASLQDMLTEYVDISEFEDGASVEETEKTKSKTINDVVSSGQNENQDVTIEPTKRDGVFSDEDSLEINDILTMESEVTPEMIEKAQARVTEAKQLMEKGGQSNDTGLPKLENFEEPLSNPPAPQEESFVNSRNNFEHHSISFDGYKKYVIYIDEKNEDYINSLTIKERKDIINTILSGENKKRIKERQLKKRKEFVVHLLLVCFCLIIGFPLMYMLTNFCLKATIDSYRQSQSNFEKLYRESGKIKMRENFRY